MVAEDNGLRGQPPLEFFSRSWQTEGQGINPAALQEPGLCYSWLVLLQPSRFMPYSSLTGCSSIDSNQRELHCSPKGSESYTGRTFQKTWCSLFFILIPNDATGDGLRLPPYSSLLLLYLKNISRSYPRSAVEFLHAKSAGDLSAQLPRTSGPPRPAAHLPGLLLGRGPSLFYWSSFCFHFNVTVKILSDNLNKVIILRYKMPVFRCYCHHRILESNICNIIQNCYSIKMIKWQWF